MRFAILHEVSKMQVSVIRSCKSSFILGTFLIVLCLPKVTNATKRNLRRVDIPIIGDKVMKASECIIKIIEARPIDPDQESIDPCFSCLMDPQDVGGIRGLSRVITGTTSQMESLKSEYEKGNILPSVTKLKLKIPGSNVLFNDDSVKLPPGLDIASSIVKPNSGSRKLNEIVSPMGEKKVLLVRVTDVNGLAPDQDATTLSDLVLGDGTGPTDVTMKTQFQACSMNKMTISPGDLSGTNNTSYQQPAPGVIEVTMPISLTEHAIWPEDGNVKDYALHEVSQLLKIDSFPGPYDHIILVFEDCYVGDCGWAAFAEVNSWFSVFKSAYLPYTSVQMHEIGHNINLAHSRGINGLEYTDHTGIMGNALPGRRCFNPAKSWQLGWYDGAEAIVPLLETQPKEEIILVGVADYENNPNGYPVVVKLETNSPDDYFLGFNRAYGINSENVEGDDEVTLVRAGLNGEGYVRSDLKATLLEGETFYIPNWANSANLLRVTATNINLLLDPAIATVEIEIFTDPVIEVTVKTDSYPGEVSWVLRNRCDNTEVMSSDLEAYNAPSTEEYHMKEVGAASLDITDYEFVINDSFCDGICCSYGSGWYEVKFGGVVVASGASYGCSETKYFGQGGCAPSPVPSSSPTFTFNPTQQPSPSPTSTPSFSPTSDLKPVFTFYQGKDSSSNDIERYWFTGITINHMAARCNALSNCVGFNTNGWMKHTLKDPSLWRHWTNDSSKGMYVSKESYPHYLAAGYKFHQGKDSPGYDIQRYWYPGITIADMAARCTALANCLGFNTNGWLKMYVFPPVFMKTWTTDPTKGFYSDIKLGY